MMKITISGTPGSGKSSIGKALAKELNLNYYDMGEVRRELAERYDLTLEELNKRGEEEDWTDKKADELQKEIGKRQDNFVFVARLGYYFIPDSIKIFLLCGLETASKRIFEDSKRRNESYNSLEETKEKIQERINSDLKRYKMYYDTDPNDTSHYDLVIDTTHLPFEDVLDRVKKFVE